MKPVQNGDQSELLCWRCISICGCYKTKLIRELENIFSKLSMHHMVCSLFYIFQRHHPFFFFSMSLSLMWKSNFYAKIWNIIKVPPKSTSARNYLSCSSYKMLLANIGQFWLTDRCGSSLPSGYATEGRESLMLVLIAILSTRFTIMKISCKST